MKTTKYLPVFIFAMLLLPAASYADNEKDLSTGFFIEKTGSDSYGCIRLRRGDIIELDGIISSYQDKEKTGLYIFTTFENRKFIIRTDTMNKDALPENRPVHLKGIIMFEGNENQLPVLKPVSLD